MRMHYGSVLSCYILAVVVEVVIKLARVVVLNKSLFADDVILMSEKIKRFWNKFIEWK